MGVGGYMAGPGASTRLLRRRLIVTRLARTATPDPGQLHHVRECCIDCQHALLPPLRRSRRRGPRDRRLFVRRRRRQDLVGGAHHDGADAESTEDEYSQACQAAKTWIDQQGGDRKSQVEPYLKMIQDPNTPPGPATYNTPWAQLSPARQAAAIVAAQAGADSLC
jgi:Putative lipoprotein LpqV